MVYRQLSSFHYKHFYEELMHHAQNRPLSPAFEVEIYVNGAHYTLFLQPEKHNKIYALYALLAVIDEDSQGVLHELITENSLLSALMELMISQGLRPH